MKYTDFHAHTIYSDGTDDPKSLVRAMKMKGIDVLAITDHDNLRAYFEAKEEAARWNLALIPGTEISTPDYHILGLNVNPENRELQEFLKISRVYQKEVCEKRIKMLHANDIPINLQKLELAFPESRLGKYNILMAMIQDRECSEYISENYPDASVYELFAKLFRKGGIADEVEGKRSVGLEESIQHIHSAGGIAIIAHPFKDMKSVAEMDELRKSGIDGLEIQPYYGDKNKPFLDYAIKHGLFITYGSDFHGASFHRPLLGRVAGENGIEESKLEDLLGVCLE